MLTIDLTSENLSLFFLLSPLSSLRPSAASRCHVMRCQADTDSLNRQGKLTPLLEAAGAL